MVLGLTGFFVLRVGREMLLVPLEFFRRAFLERKYPHGPMICRTNGLDRIRRLFRLPVCRSLPSGAFRVQNTGAL